MRAIHHLNKPDLANVFPLSRRGIALGWVRQQNPSSPTSDNLYQRQWQQLQAVPLPGIITSQLTTLHGEIARSYQWMVAIIEGASPSQLPNSNNLPSNFDLTTISADEHDQQAIEKLYFQGYEGDQAIGEAWCKVSWLSFHDEDASLRFRFSFGIEGVEDVAANPARQQLAARLCQHLFPESAAITNNPALLSLLRSILHIESIAFVERIVYFNAPNGGALFHHDVEPGHAGVIYAQLSGSTFWLALSKQQLMDEIQHFVVEHTIDLPSANQADIAAELNRPEHPQIENIIDHNPQFIHQLVEHGYGYILHTGDAILLAQDDEEACVWHSVFCLGDEPGEGLSFAMRTATLD